MKTGGWRQHRVAAIAVGGALAGLVVAASVAYGPGAGLLVIAGLTAAGRVLYPRLRREMAQRRRSEQELQARAEQQHRWAARGDLRGVYGTEGAPLMRAVLPEPRSPELPATEKPAPEPPARRAPSPPGDDLEVATVVHTGTELTTMLTTRPPGWRYAAFVSVLVQRRAAVQPRLRDAQMGFAAPDGPALRTDFDAGLFFTEQLSELHRLVEQIDDFMLSAAFQGVFGDPHHEDSADAEGIVQAANRLMDYHDRLLSVSERCRGVHVPYQSRALQRDVGRLTALPLEGFAAFIETFIERVAEVADVSRYATGDIQLDPVELRMTDDDGLMERVFDELRTVAGRG